MRFGKIWFEKWGRLASPGADVIARQKLCDSVGAVALHICEVLEKELSESFEGDAVPASFDGINPVAEGEEFFEG
jgi:hypothetical protein